jgi:hypothetical protein
VNIAGLPELILSWLKNQGAEQLLTGKEQQALAQFKPGTQYEGKVLDLLPNGRNLVQVGNQAMDMALPRQASPGDVVRLTYLNAMPRPTFAISAATTAPVHPVNVSQAAQQVSALVRYAPVTPVAPATARPAAAPATAMPAAASAARAAPLATTATLTATLASPATLTAGPAPTTAAPAAAPAATTAPATSAAQATTVPSPTAGAAAPAAPGANAAAAGNGLMESARIAATLRTAQAVLAGQAASGRAAAGAAAVPAGTPATPAAAAANVTTATSVATSTPAQAPAAATLARAGSAILADVLPATTAARGQVVTGAAVAAPGRPIVANAALLLTPGAPGAVAATATPGPAIPAMAMAGEAVDGARAPLGSNPSLTTAQGVVAEKSAASNMLPIRLQQTVKESGLFYESHLGKWVRGELPLESIQREPQARLAQMPGPLLNLPDLEGMPEEAARLASRQLHMLDGTPFLWQGQAWPGQMAEWLVRERERGEGDGAEAGQKWHSSLRLTLPRLGELAADLDIGALGLRIRLRSPSPATLAEMEAALPQLVERMRMAELNLSSIRTELGDGE